ncbi:type IV pilus assembly protein PilM [Thermosediminibacter litoriperuensis]|uniref:Type IV pilus assembly protein PilM n=1 Tax=Thermosediminibacter litoriperuensis TaxID=291989 RepID=A0A5S5AKC6_9FIRM|nr:type IV pilus assembly protein PilM [Thermosediminibacter litoriperuensis]
MDIGNHSIKVVHLNKCRGKVKVKFFLSIPNPLNGKSGTKDERRELLTQSLAPVRGHLKNRKVIVGIPSDRVLFRNLHFPRMRPSELKEAVFWETRELAGQLNGDYILDFEVMEENRDDCRVFVAAALKEHVMDYFYPVEKAGLSPEVLDVYPLAISRAVGPCLERSNLAVVNIGAERTDVTVLEGGRVFFNSCISFGSEYMTKLIAQTFSVDKNTAESIKIDPGNLRSRIRECLYPAVQQLALQVSRYLKFYTVQRKGQRVEAIVLAGGGGKLWCLREVFGHEMNVEMLTAEELDFPQITVEEKNGERFDKMEFLCALGFALRGE